MWEYIKYFYSANSKYFWAKDRNIICAKSFSGNIHSFPQSSCQVMTCDSCDHQSVCSPGAECRVCRVSTGGLVTVLIFQQTRGGEERVLEPGDCTLRSAASCRVLACVIKESDCQLVSSDTLSSAIKLTFWSLPSVTIAAASQEFVCQIKMEYTKCFTIPRLGLSTVYTLHLSGVWARGARRD